MLRVTAARWARRGFTDTLWRRPIARALSDAPNREDRYNALGIQMLPRKLHERLFPCTSDAPARSQAPEVAVAKRHLGSIQVTEFPETPAVEPSALALELPRLLGRDVEDHFYVMGQAQSARERALAEQLAASPVPAMPADGEWAQRAGWTRYDGTPGGVAVAAPPDDALVFDVETLVTEGAQPAMATAVSRTHWYSWVSPELFTDAPLTTLVSLGDRSTRRLVVGHNVGFDRARVAEEYEFGGTATAWLDTLSMHSAVGGLSTQQRLWWLKYKKAVREAEAAAGEGGDAAAAAAALAAFEEEGEVKRWLDVSSMSSLADVVELYCGEKLAKAERDIFVRGTRAEVVEQFQALMAYCARDVEHTARVFQRLLGKFLEKCPHPVSFAGMLHMGRGYLVTTGGWEDYVARCEAMYRANTQEVEAILDGLATEAVEKYGDGAWRKDPWLRRLDWTCNEVRYTQARFKKDGSYARNGEPRLVARQGPLPGKPRWYRELWDSKEGRVRVTQRSRITPYLLKLKWNGFPLYCTRKFGWTYAVPRAQRLPDPQKPLVFSADPEDPTYDAQASEDHEHFYYRVPHKDGEAVNCGDPLSRGYLSSIADGVLRSEYSAAQRIIELNVQSSYWMGSRQRILDQFVQWQTPERPLGIPTAPGDDTRFGVILPQSRVMGTVTRRAVEPTWMTASNAKPDRIGSELKAQIVAPPGHVILGADVDCQEMWISSLLGDGQFRTHGATAFGWMNLQGSKALGTDLHSNTARILGISRSEAKVFNFSRIYGAGAKHAVQLLLQYKPGLPAADALAQAQRLYTQTKGSRLNAKLAAIPDRFWHGGTESHMFNVLEHVATSDDARTPVLSCGIPDALTRRNAGNEFLTSRINWVVQSSAVDYLHMLLVSMAYLCEKFAIRARYLISIHDELRFVVPTDDAERAALALQTANLWTRAAFAQRCCVPDLPASSAFFSAVDIDRCLRKEVDDGCVTPSNPTPIPPGRADSVTQTIAETRGRLGTDQQYADEPPAVAAALERFRRTPPPRFPPVVPEMTPQHLRWLQLQSAPDEASVVALVAEAQRQRRLGSRPSRLPSRPGGFAGARGGPPPMHPRFMPQRPPPFQRPLPPRSLPPRSPPQRPETNPLRASAAAAAMQRNAGPPPPGRYMRAAPPPMRCRPELPALTSADGGSSPL